MLSSLYQTISVTLGGLASNEHHNVTWELSLTTRDPLGWIRTAGGSAGERITKLIIVLIVFQFDWQKLLFEWQAEYYDWILKRFSRFLDTDFWQFYDTWMNVRMFCPHFLLLFFRSCFVIFIFLMIKTKLHFIYYNIELFIIFFY